MLGDKFENFENLTHLMTSIYSCGSGTLLSKTRYTRRSKLEKPKNREAKKLKKNRERGSEEARKKKLKQVGRLRLTKWKWLETWGDRQRGGEWL